MPGPQRTQAFTHLEGWELERVPDVRLKAGIPTDADFQGIPRDGFTVWDSSSKRLYVRVAGVWQPITGMTGARIENSAAISIVTATLTPLTFDTGRYDTDVFHNLVGQLAVPSGLGGTYRIGGAAQFAFNAAGVRILTVTVNGADRAVTGTNAMAAGATQLTASTELALVAGDVVQVQVYQTSGGNLNVVAGTPAIWMSRIGL